MVLVNRVPGHSLPFHGGSLDPPPPPGARAIENMSWLSNSNIIANAGLQLFGITPKVVTALGLLHVLLLQMDDVSNRAHVLCHAFRQSVAAWQRSSTFAAKVQEVEPFLETLRSAFEESYKGPIELATWGEFYEYVSGGRAEAPETMPSLNASDWDQIDALADWTETALYGSHAVAGTYVGGPALSEIAVGMKWAVAQVPLKQPPL